ncbi:MAG: type II toxin-antitoxin system YafQ family toxin [Bacteroidota bacterium]
MKLLYSKKYLKDIRRLKKRRFDMEKLKSLHERILIGAFLPRDRDHALKGDLRDSRECHVSGDWVVIYRRRKEAEAIELLRTGTHQDVFKGY